MPGLLVESPKVFEPLVNAAGVTPLLSRPLQEELKAAVADKKRLAAKAATQAAAAATEQGRLKAEVQRLAAAGAAAAEAGEKPPPPQGMGAVRSATALSLQGELAKARMRAGEKSQGLSVSTKPSIPPRAILRACSTSTKPSI